MDTILNLISRGTHSLVRGSAGHDGVLYAYPLTREAVITAGSYVGIIFDGKLISDVRCRARSAEGGKRLV